jgi:cell division protein FtsW
VKRIGREPIRYRGRRTTFPDTAPRRRRYSHYSPYHTDVRANTALERNARGPVGLESLSHLRTWLRAKGFADMWHSSLRGSDLPLLLIVVALLSIGLLMVYSASMSEYNARIGQLGTTFRTQLKWVGLGSLIMLLMWRVRYTFWRNWSIELMSGVIFLLILVLIVGADLHGARRTLAHGSVQPSELAKLVMAIYLSAWMSSKGEKLRAVGFGLVPFAVLTGGIAGLVLAQPDKSTTALLIAIAISMFFVAGADLKQLGLSSILGAATLAVVISAADYARERVTDFLAFYRNPLQGGSEQLRAFIACMKAGGLLGVGLGNGTVNDFMSLPYSDSIFAVIGEELGLLGCMLVVALFVALAYRGIRIARQAPDSCGLILAFGVTAWIVLQAFMNIGVVTAVFPTTGIPLPLISYGGSAMVTGMAGIGLLLSISASKAGEDWDASRGERRGNRGSRVSRSGGR